MDLDKLKVVDLRKELQQRGLDTKGVKAALVKRLKDALDAESQDSKPSEVQPQAEEEAEEEKEAEEESEETSPVKDPPKSVSPKKEPPSTPKKDASPIKKEATPIKAATPEAEEPPTQPTTDEVEPMETESRGEKRKREDDDEPEEVELQEKKRREDNQDESEEVAPTETADTEAPAPVKERAPPKEDEPELDYEKPQLSWFDSDLHLKIDNKTFLSATPLNDGCFGYIWAGARATHGISAGKICFEVKITEELKWEDLSDRMQEKVDRQLKYRIDRRKERNEEPKEKNGNNDDNNEKTENEEVKEKTEEATSEENEDKAEEKPEGETTENTEDKKEEVAAEELEEVQNDGSNNEEKKEDETAEPEEEKEKPVLPPIPTHFFRVGFSMPGTSLQLGEVKYSYAYESTGKFLTEGRFEDYGVTFGVGDVIGAYLAIDNENVTITYTVNGVLQPTAITVPRSELPQDQFSLFPHVLCRNYAYELNFGALEEPWFPQPEELKTYQFLQQIEQKVEGPRRPENREDCEVLLMIGLPGSGKTQWVKNHITANSDKNYTVIGNHPLFDRMTVEGESMKSRFRGSWKILVDRIQKCLNQLTDRAALRRRNYIIDQTNVFPNAQRRKLRSFEGFNRKAVIVVCDDEEHARRQKDQQNDYGKTVPESTMYDLKAQMELPKKCEWVEELIFTDLGEEEAREKVKNYNEEANKKGYYKRWLNDNRRHPRNFRPGARRPGGFGPRGARFGRFPPQGPGWNRPPPSWGGRKDLRGPPSSFRQGGAPWKPPQRVPPRAPEQNRGRYNRNAVGYGGGRGQGGRNNWQNGATSNWGGNNQGGWNASLYGSHGYGAWNQNSANAQQTAAWKYGATQSTYGNGQGQRSYGGGSQGYGNNQSYGSQSGYSQNWYGNQDSGYSDNWNNYYGQQQGWGNHQKRQ